VSAPPDDPHAGGPVLQAGAPLHEARAAAILIHGRGSSAADIIRLADNVDSGGVAFLKPQAAGNSWYPHRFLAPVAKNEPHLSSALALIGRLVREVANAGIATDRTMLLGFSQGACLALEYSSRSSERLGAVAALSGALIGPLDEAHPPLSPTVAGLPVFLGCGDEDDHIGMPYLERTARLFRDAGAAVDLRIYKGMAHTINRDEVEAVRQHLAVLTGRLTRAD